MRVVETREEPGIITMLRQVESGLVASEASDELRTLVKKVSETRKGGSLTLTIKVEPGKATSLKVMVTSKASVPKDKPDGSTFFDDGNGNLLRDNPDKRQRTLPLLKEDEDSSGMAAGAE